MSQLKIESFYHQDSQTYSHLAVDLTLGLAAIIDPVMDYDPNTGKVRYVFIEELLARLRENQWELKWILETHVHADHLSCAQYLKQKTQAQVVIAKTVAAVQKHFDVKFDMHSANEDLFEVLVTQGDKLPLGNFQIEVMATPGHTQACITYLIADGEQVHGFIGDTLFMPDVGSARCDFPGGDAQALYASIQKLYALPEQSILYLCHDYPPVGRQPQANVTVLEQKNTNVHCRHSTTLNEFVAIRNGRDANLAAPRLILPSLQVNIRAGHLPEADKEGRVFIKIPITVS